MRGLASNVLTLFFVLTVSIVVIAYSLSSILEPNFIKNRLDQGNIYSAIAEGLNSQSEARGEEDRAQEALPEKKLEGPYLKKKVEPFVDDTFSYFEGTKNEVPALNFEDLLTKKEKKELGDKQLEIELANAQGLRSAYQNLKNAPLIFGLVSLFLLLPIFLLGTTWGVKIRKVSSALFAAAFSGLILTLVTLAASNLLVEMLSSLVSGGQFDSLSEPIRTALKPIPSVLGEKMALAYLGIFASAILLLLISFLVHTRKEALQNLKAAQETFIRAFDKLQKISPEESRKSVSDLRNEAKDLRSKVYRELLKQTPPEIK